MLTAQRPEAVVLSPNPFPESVDSASPSPNLSLIRSLADSLYPFNPFPESVDSVPPAPTPSLTRSKGSVI
jgi:hypothetical protein